MRFTRHAPRLAKWSPLSTINGSSDQTHFTPDYADFSTDMSTNPIIRHVARPDYAQWLPLWNGYNAFYGRSGPTSLPSEITEMTWARFFDTYEPVYALVTELDGQLVGLAHYLFHRSTISINSICYLQDLFTHESARGKGTGTALINAVYDQAKHSGCRRVYWHTHETNKTARCLYDQVAENAGFIVYRNHAWTQQPEPQMHGDLRR